MDTISAPSASQSAPTERIAALQPAAAAAATITTTATPAAAGHRPAASARGGEPEAALEAALVADLRSGPKLASFLGSRHSALWAVCDPQIASFKAFLLQRPSLFVLSPSGGPGGTSVSLATCAPPAAQLPAPPAAPVPAQIPAPSPAPRPAPPLAQPPAAKPAAPAGFAAAAAVLEESLLRVLRANGPVTMDNLASRCARQWAVCDPQIPSFKAFLSQRPSLFVLRPAGPGSCHFVADLAPDPDPAAAPAAGPPAAAAAAPAAGGAACQTAPKAAAAERVVPPGSGAVPPEERVFVTWSLARRAATDSAPLLVADVRGLLERFGPVALCDVYTRSKALQRSSTQPLPPTGFAIAGFGPSPGGAAALVAARGGLEHKGVEFRVKRWNPTKAAPHPRPATAAATSVAAATSAAAAGTAKSAAAAGAAAAAALAASTALAPQRVYVGWRRLPADVAPGQPGGSVQVSDLLAFVEAFGPLDRFEVHSKGPFGPSAPLPGGGQAALPARGYADVLFRRTEGGGGGSAAALLAAGPRHEVSGVKLKVQPWSRPVEGDGRRVKATAAGHAPQTAARSSARAAALAKPGAGGGEVVAVGGAGEREWGDWGVAAGGGGGGVGQEEEEDDGDDVDAMMALLRLERV